MRNCYITGSCAIVGNRVIIDDQCDFIQEDFTDFASFIKSAYKHFNVTFPKFYKMDNLSKLAFMTSELMLKESGLTDRYKKEEIAIILLNSSSTLETDDKHFNTIQNRENYFPSPAVFVYTLPNIMIGEICIRNKIMGENTALVSENYDPQLLSDYIGILMEGNNVNACIAGWVEYERRGLNYESVMYLIEKHDLKERNIIFEKSFLEKHYSELKAYTNG